MIKLTFTYIQLPVNQFNNISWLDVVTPTDNSKSVNNRCVTQVLVCFLPCQFVVEFSVGIGA